MGTEADRFEQLIDHVHARVLASETLDEALDALVLALRDRYKLWRAGLWVFEPPDAARLVAVWSIGDTLFEEDMVVRFSLTDDVGFLAGALLRGRPVMFRTGERDLGLLTDVLHREGVASMVIQPVGARSKEPIAFLVLASSGSDVFKAKEIRLTSALTRGIAERLTTLIEAAVGGTDA